MASLSERLAYVRGLVAAYEAVLRLSPRPISKKMRVWVTQRLTERSQELERLASLQKRETNPELH